jgi:hypothetical protein
MVYGKWYIVYDIYMVWYMVYGVYTIPWYGVLYSQAQMASRFVSLDPALTLNPKFKLQQSPLSRPHPLFSLTHTAPFLPGARAVQGNR